MPLRSYPGSSPEARPSPPICGSCGPIPRHATAVAARVLAFVPQRVRGPESKSEAGRGPLVQPYVGRCAARPAERQAPSLDCVGAGRIRPLRSVMAAAAAAAGPTSVSLSGLRAEASTDVPGSQPNGLRPAGLTKKRSRFLFGRSPPAIRLGGPPVEPQVLTTARCGLRACARGNSRRSRTAVGVLAGSRPGSRLLAAEPWLGTRCPAHVGA